MVLTNVPKITGGAKREYPFLRKKTKSQRDSWDSSWAEAKRISFVCQVADGANGRGLRSRTSKFAWERRKYPLVAQQIFRGDCGVGMASEKSSKNLLSINRWTLLSEVNVESERDRTASMEFVFKSFYCTIIQIFIYFIHCLFR